MSTRLDTLSSAGVSAVAAALAKAQAEFGRATKDARNDHFGNAYTTLAAALAAVLPSLNAHGLALVQATYIAEGGVVVLRSTLWHSSGEWLACEFPILPTKSDPQSFGSALTYARRYALMALCGIAPEDDDGNAASAPPAVRSKAVSAAGSAGKPRVGKPSPVISADEVDAAIANWSDAIDAAATAGDLRAIAAQLRQAPAPVREDVHLRARYTDRLRTVTQLDADRAELDGVSA